MRLGRQRPFDEPKPGVGIEHVGDPERRRRPNARVLVSQRRVDKPLSLRLVEEVDEFEHYEPSAEVAPT